LPRAFHPFSSSLLLLLMRNNLSLLLLVSLCAQPKLPIIIIIGYNTTTLF
jgi:hypothetical protein